MKNSSPEVPQVPNESINPKNTLFYAMQRLASDKPMEDEERARLTSLTMEKMREENVGQSILEMVRCARESKNLEMLRFALEALQKRIHKGSSLGLISISDTELQGFLEGEDLTVLVGSGTHGHRLILQGRELSLPFDEQHSGRFAENFRVLFGLAEKDNNLRVSI